MKNKKMHPFVSIILGIIFFIVLLLTDQFSKKWAVMNLKDQQPIVLIRNVFQLCYLENHGAAFGILQGKSIVFICITILVLAFIIFFYCKIPFTSRFRIMRIFMVLIAAGAVGNFIDRVSLHYVVDFFYFEAINFPIFNVADIYVTCATILLILSILFWFKDEDIHEILVSVGWKKEQAVVSEEK